MSADARGAGGEFLRLGGPAGLLADLGQTVKRLCHKGVVAAEHLLANRQRPAKEGLGFSISAITAVESGKPIGVWTDAGLRLVYGRHGRRDGSGRSPPES